MVRLRLSAFIPLKKTFETLHSYPIVMIIADRSTSNLSFFFFVLCISTQCYSIFSETTTYTCDYAWTCSYDSIVLNSTNSRIECWAYQSCHHAMKLITSGNTGTQLVRCSGSLGCYDSDMIVAGGSSSSTGNIGEIGCEGYHSCARSNLYSQNTIQCDGSFGCANSIITFDSINEAKYSKLDWNISSTAVTVYCRGNYACSGATLTSVSSIFGWGKFALFYAAIYSNGSNLNVSLDSHNSGLYLNIFCTGESDTCYLKCTGNSCYQTYFHCKAKSLDILGNKELNCRYDCESADICAYICVDNECMLGNGTNINNGGNFGLDELETSIVWNETVWREERERFEKYFDLFNYDTFYCGTSENSESVNASICDAYGPLGDCFASNESIVNDAGGAICCLGFVSCAFPIYSNVFLDTSARMQTSSKAVKQSELSSILCDGANSCELMSIINTNGDVYCSGLDSCRNGLIYGNVYDIDSLSYSSNNDSFYNNLTRLYCDGSLACFEAKINNFNDLYCNGMNSCAFTKIMDAVNIYGAGLDTLHSARIFANRNSNVTVYLQVGFVATNLSVFCNETNHCEIVCEAKHACSNVTLYCSNDANNETDNCKVGCNETEVTECPKIIYNYGFDLFVSTDLNNPSTTNAISSSMTETEFEITNATYESNLQGICLFSVCVC